MTELAFPSGLSRSLGVVSLQSIVELLKPREVQRFRHLAVDGLSFHSSEVAPGNLFFAIRGTRQNGSAYAEDACRRGALAVVAEEPLNVPCPVLIVRSARRALADAACFFNGDPSRRLPVVGITGTNGKTTVAHLVRQILESTGRRVGLIGTTGFEFAERQVPTTTTTPDPLRIHGYLREMADRQASACVMEVSSHALTQERVRGVDFRVAAFLNLTQDHLDYHGSLEKYIEAKSLLFSSLEQGSYACINVDSPVAAAMMNAVPKCAETRTFGFGPDAQVRAENLRCSLDGTRLDLVMPRGRVELMLRLPGRHNVENALAAAQISLALGVSELSVTSALEQARPARGRLQKIQDTDGLQAFVDYAHTPDALEQVCRTLKQLGNGRLIAVFGCGGDRDRTKRAPMAQAVGRYADQGFMTSDNPRSEDPESILDDMELGLASARGSFFRVVDRQTAIRRAVFAADPGDTVLVAGKGHETYQVLKDSVIPFDDCEALREALRARHNRLHGAAPVQAAAGNGMS